MPLSVCVVKKLSKPSSLHLFRVDEKNILLKTIKLSFFDKCRGTSWHPTFKFITVLKKIYRLLQSKRIHFFKTVHVATVFICTTSHAWSPSFCTSNYLSLLLEFDLFAIADLWVVPNWCNAVIHCYRYTFHDLNFELLMFSISEVFSQFWFFSSNELTLQLSFYMNRIIHINVIKLQFSSYSIEHYPNFIKKNGSNSCNNFIKLSVQK